MSCRPYPLDAEENASYVLAYGTDNLLSTVDMTVNGTTWRRTFTWNTDAFLTDITIWVKQ